MSEFLNYLLPWRELRRRVERESAERQAIFDSLSRIDPLLGELQSLREQLAVAERRHWELLDRVNRLSDNEIGGSPDEVRTLNADYAYASLGWNCEAAYQFRRVKGGDRSSFFNWTYCHLEPMINIIDRDFEGLLKWENVGPSGVMVYDALNNIAFHGAVFRKSEQGKYTDLARHHLAALQSKTLYLVEKWRKLTASSAFVTYFVKLPEMGDGRKAAIWLRDTLARKYRTHKFQLVVLQSKEHAPPSPDWGERKIHNRYLDRFAPDDHPEDGDAASWDRVFEEFPLR